jgi:transglutaminase-like putative cysteine protease
MKPLSEPTPFLDDRQIDWHTVRRTRCQFYQRFQYTYPGPIQDLHQRLIVIPADQYGSQRLCQYDLTASPPVDVSRERRDAFGNRIFEFEVAEADASVLFEVQMTVEQESGSPAIVHLSRAALAQLTRQTRLTRANHDIKTVALALQAEASDAPDLAQRISDWVYSVMRYGSGVTTVETTASEVMRLRAGLCQDYAHLMLSLCRVSGLAARYVSGHLLGEGGSHAWVEVLVPTDQGIHVLPFDPTNNCHPDLSYITVAVGRDYRDVSPTSGSFTAPYGGSLIFSKRAGLTMIEYLSGEIVRAQ